MTAHVYGLEDDIIKTLIFPQMICRLNEIPVRILGAFFYWGGQAVPKVYIEIQGTQTSRNNLEKKNKGGGLILSNFKTYYKVTIFKTMWQLALGYRSIG